VIFSLFFGNVSLSLQQFGNAEWNILEPSIANNSFDSYQVVYEYLRLDNFSFSDPFQATAIDLWLVGHNPICSRGGYSDGQGPECFL
jgi:hypothetical protein